MSHLDQSPLSKCLSALLPRLQISLDEAAPPGQRILAAVSGGADSMSLLWVLKYFERDVVVAHINHGLRSEESDADAAFVQQHCQDLDIPFVVSRVQVETTGSVETAAREARYAALIEMAGQQECALIATGHTASDQLETVLLNWLRGAAVTGLRGMEPVREIAPQVLLVRPLLPLTREETQQICTEVNWPWRDDSSNRSTLHRRNAVRHELLPCLEKLMNGKGARQQLARQTQQASAILRDDLDYLDALANEHLAALVLKEEKDAASHLLILDSIAWSELPVALQRRVLRVAVQRVDDGKLSGEIGLEKIETLRRQILSKGRRMVWQWRHDLWAEWTGVASGNRIRLRVVREELPSPVINAE
jgi:tRNA(Ile)-lysidine synthase